MSTRVVDQVDSWEKQSFSGGYDELHQLADAEFSGVVRAGGAELYVTRGVVVGVRSGSIEDFESGSGSIYEAPTDALPLLAIMQERSDEVRAKYYSEETSIAKVDQTLTDGGFTGYIELSENVLSGDYYLVYHAGTSMSVAYVGESGKLIHGDEAFETADDEVGIYEVRPVDIEPVEIPEPATPEGDGETDESDGTGAADPSTEEQASASADEGSTPDDAGEELSGTEESRETTRDESGRGKVTRDESGSGTQGRSRGETAARDGSRGAAEPTDSTPADETDSGESAVAGTSSTGQAASGTTRPERGKSSGDSGARERSASDTPAESGQQPGTRSRGSGGARGAGDGGAATRDSRSRRQDERSAQRGRSRGATSSQDLETKAIPSIDPDATEVPDNTSRGSGGTGVATRTAETQQPPQQARETHAQAPDAAPAGEPSPTDGDRGADPEATGAAETARVDELETELEEKETEIDRLETELEEATGEREDLEAELESVRNERDELDEEVQRLQDELTRLEEELGAATDAERRMTGGEALAGTDIFVRYRSKGKATLEKAHGGSTRKDDVTENLRLEKHTQFDASTVAVGGKSYEEFLEETLEYQFVRWVVQDLLFEIRDTGHEKELRDLYDVLPRVDRAELSGVIDVTYVEDGQETQSQESFDVVLRDRMGTPLLAANLNASREATTESMMERLITSAERVGQATQDFSGAFLVTESFFDPGALEVASEATQGGLLSRDKRKSFVNLTRKQGYHLCLVEARSENFTLAVPEL